MKKTIFILAAMTSLLAFGQRRVENIRSDFQPIEQLTQKQVEFPDPVSSELIDLNTTLIFVETLNEIFDSLINQGFSKIGKIDITQMKRQLQQVKFFKYNNTNFYPQGRSGHGFFYVSEKAVFFESRILNKFFEIGRRPMSQIEDKALLLHEFLGSLGYVDDDYQISSVLMLPVMKFDLNKFPMSAEYIFSLNLETRTTNPDSSLHPPFLESARFKSIVARGGGGSTGLGGGGDHLIAGLKARLLYKALLAGFKDLYFYDFLIKRLRIEYFDTDPLEFTKLNFTVLRRHFEYPFAHKLIFSRNQEKAYVALVFNNQNFDCIDQLVEHLYALLTQSPVFANYEKTF